MPDIFRFRSHRYLLEYGELEQQEIYFAPSDSMNDPMEGSADYYWSGDRIVFENLFRHYVLFLINAASLCYLGWAPPASDNFFATMIQCTHSKLPTELAKSEHNDCVDNCFAHPEMNKIYEICFSSPEVRRDQLIFILNRFHAIAMPVVLRKVLGDGAERGAFALFFGDEHAIRSADVLAASASLQSDESNIVARSSVNLAAELMLLQFLHEPNNLRNPWIHLCLDLPRHYVEALPQLVHWSWCAACFSENATHGGMWGHYADGHKGSCLIYSPEQIVGGAFGLNLQTCWGAKENTLDQGLEFRRVQYVDRLQPIDFFRSIGVFSREVLERDWHSDRSGASSVCRISDCGIFAKAYWDRFSAIAGSKMLDWQHENEFRLVRTGMLERFDTPESYKMRYRFDSLRGLIFGARASTRDKLAIMKIIDRKCEVSGRKDFTFFQAYYNELSGLIDFRPLTLLRRE